MRFMIRSFILSITMIAVSLSPHFVSSLRSDSHVTLSWNKNLEYDVLGYRIHYGILPGQYEFTVDTDSDTCYTVTDLEDMTYYFVVTAYDTAGNESDYSEELSCKPGEPVGITDDGGFPPLPRAHSLSQNYPNPFNPQTTIQYTVGDQSGGIPVATTLTVYSMRGQAVKSLVDEEKEPGDYLVHWNGTSDSGEMLASGTYLYRLQAGTFTSVRKMVLRK